MNSPSYPPVVCSKNALKFERGIAAYYSSDDVSGLVLLNFVLLNVEFGFFPFTVLANGYTRSLTNTFFLNYSKLLSITKSDTTSLFVPLISVSSSPSALSSNKFTISFIISLAISSDVD
jgi:hypothetical protein